MSIKIIKSHKTRISEVDFNNLSFGKEFSDHVFIAEYDGQNWVNIRIQPFESVALNLSLSALHYGQSIFEGLKAHRDVNNQIQIFRPNENFNRMNKSAQRMCMQDIPHEIFFTGLTELCKIDNAWISNIEGNSYYLRPLLFATDESLGVHSSQKYMFTIFGCAVGAYYSQALKIKVETEYTRAALGGTGEAKTAGNYAASLFATKIANKEGFHQILWTDAFEHKYLEELGSSNIFILSGNTLITPSLKGTVLHGITRDSVIKISEKMGIKIEERLISIDEVFDLHNSGKLDEMFATGTAATVVSLKELSYLGNSIIFDENKNHLATKLKTIIQNIKLSKSEDIFNWNYSVNINETYSF